jgi:ammonia channel protein AmtB
MPPHVPASIMRQVSGAVAERIQFQAYASFVLLLSLLLFPMVVHWVWSDSGFLSARRPPEDRLFGCGVVDLAGSGVVHMTGGVAALIAIVLLGPRDGVTFTPEGRRRAPPGQSAAFQTLGTLFLWFGWFGFNGCSVGEVVSGCFCDCCCFRASRPMILLIIPTLTHGYIFEVSLKIKALPSLLKTCTLLYRWAT